MKKIVLAWLVAMLGVIPVAEASVHRGKNPYSNQNNPVVEPIYSDDTAAGFFANEAARMNKQQGNNPQKTKTPPQIHNTVANGDLVNKASAYIGETAGQIGLPRSLWCADFMNMITRSGSDRHAKSYIHRGTPAPYGCTNCVVVTARRGGGHVGVVIGYDKNGNPITISGNHGNRVGVGVYVKSKVIAYRYIS